MDRLTVDINCDLGEGCGNDAELMKFISSANIACGYHAGDVETMKRTVDLAIENGVAIGAHPGYRDRENFGRTGMKLSDAEVREIITDQIASLDRIVNASGGRLAHVKPHGALYNQSAQDVGLAAEIARAVYAFDPQLILFGLSGSESIHQAETLGLATASEVFADRTYQNDGTLTPRSRPDALIHGPNQCAEQVLDMIKYGRVRTTDGVMISIKAETICIHGDGEHAVTFATSIRQALAESNVEVRSLAND